jgi:hypothetical protein
MVMAASFEAIERFENRLSNFDIGTGPVGAALERADHALGSDRDAKTQSLRSDSRSFHALVMTMLMSWAVKGGFMRTPAKSRQDSSECYVLPTGFRDRQEAQLQRAVARER